MTLTHALLFLAFVLANLVFGVVAMYRYGQVTTIIQQRHPEVWRTFQSYSNAARRAAGRFYCSRAPFRLGDPELSRAVTRAWIATGVWIAVVLCGLATWTVRGG